jgi:formylmethanofuran dehydrogenase subunit A
MHHYELRLKSGELQYASGIIPVPYSEKKVSVSWKKTAAGIDWALQTPAPVCLHLPEQDEPVWIQSEFRATLPCK